MHHWQLAYLGRHTFPTEVTDFELQQVFTFDGGELEDIGESQFVTGCVSWSIASVGPQCAGMSMSWTGIAMLATLASSPDDQPFVDGICSADAGQKRRNTMSRIFISGSSTGLGMMAAKLLDSQGHKVVLHARSDARASDAHRELPRAKAIVTGDVETIAGAREVAAKVNALGRFDAVMHNAAVGYREGHRVTADGLPHVFAINTLSAYILTALIERPKRLVYLSSGMHHHADANLDDIRWTKRRWNGSTAYAESKLHDAMLAFAIARRWPEVFSNSLEPGWVPTKMGGAAAPDDMKQAHLTQAWLAAGDDPKADVTGEYFYHLKRMSPNPQAHDPFLQDRLIEICADISSVALPA